MPDLVADQHVVHVQRLSVQLAEIAARARPANLDTGVMATPAWAGPSLANLRMVMESLQSKRRAVQTRVDDAVAELLATEQALRSLLDASDKDSRATRD
jgi:hypothetical protein